MKRSSLVVVGFGVLASCGLVASLVLAQQSEVCEACTSRNEVVVTAPLTTMRIKGPAEENILKALRNPVAFEFDNTPLSEVIIFLQDKYSLQIIWDSRVLSDAGIDPTAVPITARINGVSLRSALNLVLGGQGLTWYIADEMLRISTKEQADSTFETRLYDVRDLTTNDRDTNGTPDFDSLIKTIVGTVKGNWQQSGGAATIRAFGNNGVRALVVAQTFDGHEQIETMLAELRKLKPQR